MFIYNLAIVYSHRTLLFPKPRKIINYRYDSTGDRNLLLSTNSKDLNPTNKTLVLQRIQQSETSKTQAHKKSWDNLIPENRQLFIKTRYHYSRTISHSNKIKNKIFNSSIRNKIYSCQNSTKIFWVLPKNRSQNLGEAIFPSFTFCNEIVSTS